MTLASYLLNPGEERIVGLRLGQALRAARVSAAIRQCSSLSVATCCMSATQQPRFRVAVGGIMHA